MVVCGHDGALANLTVTGPRYGPVGSGALPAAFRKQDDRGLRPELVDQTVLGNAVEL